MERGHQHHRRRFSRPGTSAQFVSNGSHGHHIGSWHEFDSFVPSSSIILVTICSSIVLVHSWPIHSLREACRIPALDSSFAASSIPSPDYNTWLPHCWCSGGSVISRAGNGSESESHETSIMLLLLPALEFRLLPPRPRTVRVVCP